MPSFNLDDYELPFSVRSVGRGIIFALSIALLLSVCAGVVYHFSAFSERTLPGSASVILALSAFGGSLAAGRHAGGKGLYHGLAVGFLFFIIVWATAALFIPGHAGLNLIGKLIIIMSCGTVGGVIGVGLR